MLSTNHKLKETFFSRNPFRSNGNFFESTCSFNEGHFKAIKDASKFFRIWIFSGAESKAFQKNLWFGLLLGYFPGFQYFSVFSCSFQCVSAFFLVSPLLHYHNLYQCKHPDVLRMMDMGFHFYFTASHSLCILYSLS